MDKTRILIADDHNIVRLAIKTLLRDQKDVEIIGEAVDGIEVMEFVNNNETDIVLLDVSMPKLTGIETTKLIKKDHPSVKVLILTMHEREEMINELINAGADGYLLKNLNKEEITNGIKTVMRGEKYFSDEVSNILIDSYLNNNKLKEMKAVTEQDTVFLKEVLTKREQEIVKLILKGLTSKEIGNALFVSTRTVETHRSNLLKKLNIKNTAELAKIAASQGFV
jgi:two-component system, NarL family, nitrate/nitrite response regulator NarL